MVTQTTYAERYRPQFHFTAMANWLNDPNGCVYSDGMYHLFFQHNPFGREWGNMTWGHAVSRDLVHWRQRLNAIQPYGDGTIFSGSAVVDSANTSGLGRDGVAAMVAFFTHARRPFGQAMAYSLDQGQSWRLYEDGRHVVVNQGLDAEERDPKVFWHEPSGRWVMVLWGQRGKAVFFASENLRDWKAVGEFAGDGFYECPDLVELPVEGENAKRWVIYDAALSYWVGDFDGQKFVAEAGPFRGDHGGNFYAAQTWNHAPGRVVQIGWMRDGKYPGMPFNQQMSFPCSLGLVRTAEGLRLARRPVAEIASLYANTDRVAGIGLAAGERRRFGGEGDLFDISLRARVGAGAELRLHLHNLVVTCTAESVGCLGHSARLPAGGGALGLRVLVDRTSIEVFAADGLTVMSWCFVPEQLEAAVELEAAGGNVEVPELVVHRLVSAWTGRGG